MFFSAKAEFFAESTIKMSSTFVARLIKISKKIFTIVNTQFFRQLIFHIYVTALVVSVKYFVF